jgi:hypothetical protein
MQQPVEKVPKGLKARKSEESIILEIPILSKMHWKTTCKMKVKVSHSV